MGKYDTWDYTKQYREKKIKRITLDVQTETYEAWKLFADEIGLPLATFIKQAVSVAVKHSGDSRQ